MENHVKNSRFFKDLFWLQLNLLHTSNTSDDLFSYHENTESRRYKLINDVSFEYRVSNHRTLIIG